MILPQNANTWVFTAAIIGKVTNQPMTDYLPLSSDHLLPVS